MKIQRNGSQPSKPVPAEYFTGTVRLDTPFKAEPPGRVGGASVTFEPGARTNWHTHPLGQTLLVTAGMGWVQREGGPVEEIRPGDVVWFPAREKHWHGATPTTAMTHLATSRNSTARTPTGWSPSPTSNTANNPKKRDRTHEMAPRRKCWLAAAFLACLHTHSMDARQPSSAIAPEVPGKVVRLARLQIDPAQLESYRAALAQEIATSVRVEPGVIALNAVTETHDPTRVTILEIYSNEETYQAHLQTPHFKEYKTSTLHMVKSLELVDVAPVFLGTKAQ